MHLSYWHSLLNNIYLSWAVVTKLVLILNLSQPRLVSDKKVCFCTRPCFFALFVTFGLNGWQMVGLIDTQANRQPKIHRTTHSARDQHIHHTQTQTQTHTRRFSQCPPAPHAGSSLHFWSLAPSFSSLRPSLGHIRDETVFDCVSLSVFGCTEEETMDVLVWIATLLIPKGEISIFIISIFI